MKPHLPLVYRWTGEAHVPANKVMVEAANDQFVVGQTYSLEVVEDRSAKSHRHYFVEIHETWKHLPENLIALYPTEDHLRKRVLIQAGFCDTTSTVFDSKAAAVKAAAMVRGLDEFVLVTCIGTVVTVSKAWSQKYTRMDKKTFQDSKDKVMQICAGMIGVTPDEFRRNMGREV